ncbi:aminoacyltransferase, partial [Candidatus Gracilibacteria bacterium]|nr:aminoacyltransferase [Candidatus Gracilibacteria bacterium]
MYKLKKISDKNIWNNFTIKNAKFYSFLNSWEWGKFNEKQGNQVFYFGIYKNEDELVGIFMMILHKAKRGTYLFCPHGPQILESENFFEVLENLKPQLKKIAK